MCCTKKSCEAKCKCKINLCICICVLSWVVLIVCLVFGFLVILSPEYGAYYPYVVPSAFDIQVYKFLLFLLFFEAFSALGFIIFTKFSPYWIICNCFRLLWLFVHFVLAITTFVLIIHLDPDQYTVEFLKQFAIRDILNSEDFGQLPRWLKNLQKKMGCCGIEGTTDYTEPQLKEHCIEIFQNRTVEKGCATTLRNYCKNCQQIFLLYAAIALCIGLIPFVICSLTQRKTYKKLKARRLAAAMAGCHPQPSVPDMKQQPAGNCNCYDRQHQSNTEKAKDSLEKAEEKENADKNQNKI